MDKVEYRKSPPIIGGDLLIIKNMNESLKTKFIAQTNEYYQAYGYFMVEFEQMIDKIRYYIEFTINNDPNKQPLINALLAGLTADPLILKLKAFIDIIYKDSPEEITHAKSLIKFCISINETRNQLIHSIHDAGFASEEQTEFDIISCRKISRNGSEVTIVSYSASSLTKLTSQVKVANKLICLLLACHVGGKKPTELLIQADIDLLK